MTFLYTRTNSWSSTPQQQHPNQDMINLWNHVAEKANWRIVQLPNGFYKTEYKHPDDEDTWVDVTRRETIEGAESDIDGSVEH